MGSLTAFGPGGNAWLSLWDDRARRGLDPNTVRAVKAYDVTLKGEGGFRAFSAIAAALHEAGLDYLMMPIPHDVNARALTDPFVSDLVEFNFCVKRLNGADPDSATCVDMLARITRTVDGSIYGVHVNPINIARERTQGVDAASNLRFDTPVGLFRLNAGYTWVDRHDIQEYPDEAVVDQFAVNSGYDIPRTKASLLVGWEKNAWSASVQGRRLGSLPNGWSYDEVWEEGDPGPKIGATYRYNANVQFRFNDHSQISFSVVNLFDKMPPVDPTYTSYPYYDISWFDTEGRSYYVQYTHKFGGSPL